MILEFAKPLIYADPAGPPDITSLRMVLQLAETCWNLPVFEKNAPAQYGAVKRQFDTALAAVPGQVASVLRQLVADRTTTFAAVPFYVQLRVAGETLEAARVVAEARMPQATP